MNTICPACQAHHEKGGLSYSDCPNTAGKSVMHFRGVTCAAQLAKSQKRKHFKQVETHMNYFEFIHSLITHLRIISLNHDRKKAVKIALKHVSKLLADNWADEIKVDLMNELSASGFFSKPNKASKTASKTTSNICTPTQLLISLQPTWFPPYVFLWMIASLGVGNDHVSLMSLIENWDKDELEGLMLFLEDFLRLPNEEKWAQIESYPFFIPKLRELNWADDKIDAWLKRVSLTSGIPLTEDYFSHQRPSFVQQLLSYCNENLISTDSAAMIMVRHLGKSSHKEQCDAILMLALCPVLAERVKTLLDLSIEIPKYQIANPLSTEIDLCVDGAHDHQTNKGVSIIRSKADLDLVQLEYRSDEILLVHVSGIRDPRKIRNGADLISFKAHQSVSLYAFSPMDIPADLRTDIIQYFSTKILFANPFFLFETELQQFPQFASIYRAIDTEKVTTDFAGSVHATSMARFVWGKPLCSITNEDWFTEQLTPVQGFHIAYFLNMSDAFLNKVGVSVMHDPKYQTKFKHSAIPRLDSTDPQKDGFQQVVNGGKVTNSQISNPTPPSQSDLVPQAKDSEKEPQKDPQKRLKYLKKRVRQIVVMEKKFKEGRMGRAPTKNDRDKMAKKLTLMEEINLFEEQLKTVKIC